MVFQKSSHIICGRGSLEFERRMVITRQSRRGREEREETMWWKLILQRPFDSSKLPRSEGWSFDGWKPLEGFERCKC